MSINGSNVHEIPEIDVCVDSHLNFTIRGFTWFLVTDHDMNDLPDISLPNLKE